jgi:anti-sigma regulatory factor (Ser/Thr protein kinase)
MNRPPARCWKGSPPSRARKRESVSAPRTCSRDFPGTVEAASDAENWVASQASALGLGEEAEFAINLCLEELFLNAVKHGHANRASISVCAEAHGVTVEFADDGEPFDPTLAPAKRISGPTQDFEIGGYGTRLMQKFSRRMSYRRFEGMNRLVLEFDAARNPNAGPDSLSMT